MNEETGKFETICSQSDIAAYLDGELDAAAEARLEAHLSACKDCFNALGEQKMVLCALNAALDGRAEIELPVNFARKVAVRAESGMNGLRKREERAIAVTLCIMLFGLIAAVGLTGDGAGLAEILNGGLRMGASVAGFVGAVFYDIGLGTVVIIRTLTRYFLSDQDLYGFGIFCLLLLSLILCSSFYLRLRRLKF
jgi:predicted anti-sigma-YlaC factor YlaD